MRLTTNRIIINLPYTSAAVPPPVARRLGLSPEEWQLEHWRLIDPHLGELVREAACYERRDVKTDRPVVVYPLSPLVADPWGLWAAELAEEAPAAPPKPAVISRTTAGRALPPWSEKDAELILNRSVAPFHREITEAARRLLAETPLVLVLTLRSFGSMPLPFEKCRKYPRPQAAIGSRPGLTPTGLAELAGGVLKSCRWWPELDWPQAEGACLPPELAESPRVRALGLSLCRGLYFDERTGRRKSSAQSVVRVLRTLFNLLDQEMARVAQVRLDRALAPKKKARPSPVIKASQIQSRT
ncbi:MAG: N-formylglutamate amidohydrolase [Candidatus Adiutrix sp.]|jgi:hypothetical protein|nr:N-formylglutamate amidohydrolase [Candidatus Adiutrix sp.]